MNKIALTIALITIILMLTLCYQDIPIQLKQPWFQGVIILLIIAVATANIYLALIMGLGYLFLFQDIKLPIAKENFENFQYQDYRKRNGNQVLAYSDDNYHVF